MSDSGSVPVFNFADRLAAAIKAKNNPSVAGLDPRIEYVPAHLIEKARKASISGDKRKWQAEAVLSFNKGLIDALHDIVPAVKLQIAFYELLGCEGMEVFRETAIYASQKQMLVIADAKRGDIGSTAEAYAQAFLSPGGPFEADALTVNPYFGCDGIKPFIDACAKNGKGIFILVKTSNKSSIEFQDIETSDRSSGRTRPLYELVAEKVREWGNSQGLAGSCGYNSIGAVVGATYPAQAVALREVMPRAFILVPGYGAQGGTAADAACSFGSGGAGAIVNASRSIMCACMTQGWKDKFGGDMVKAGLRYADAAREEALRMKEDLNSALISR